MGGNCIGMMVTKEDPIEASTDMIGVTHPTAITLIPHIGGVMIITRIIESIATPEKESGVITVITGTEVTLTIHATANTGITEVTGITTHTEIMEATGNVEVTESIVDTGSMENIDIMGPQTECPLEHPIGRTATGAKRL